MYLTEKSNSLTNNIDFLEIKDALHLHYKIEEDVFLEIFSKNKTEIINFIELLVSFLLKKDSKIILHGSGTSGRFAVLIANHYNSLFKTNKIIGEISGGFDAFIKSKEGSEDDVLENISLIKKHVSCENILYLGISCSGASNGVLGSIYYLKSLPLKNIKTGLFFLNNKDSIKKTIPHYNLDFKDIFSKLDFSINYLVGAEPISGSTRLKGGSITQMLLDISFVIAGIKTGLIPFEKDLSISTLLQELLWVYYNNYKSLSGNVEHLAPIIKTVNKFFKENGNLYYFCDDVCAPVSLIDASECLPTFGVDFEVVRAFAEHGFQSIFNDEQIKSISSFFKKEHAISFESIDIKKEDCLIFIFFKTPSDKIISFIKGQTNKNIFIISFNSLFSDIPSLNLNLNTNFYDFENLAFIRHSQKYLLNLITTQSFVFSGKTLGNLMIDLKLSCYKLIERAIYRVIYPIVKDYREVSSQDIIHHLNHNTNLFLNQKHSLSEILDARVYFQVQGLVPLTILTLLGDDYPTALKKLSLKKHFSFLLKDFKKKSEF